jgi:hypothetical protein
METSGSISAAEASAALTSAERSRERVAWTGYPAWYWLSAAAVMALLPIATLVPVWLGLLVTAVVGVSSTVLAVAVNRARGVCEGWVRTAMRARDVAVLYGPAVAVALAGTFGARFGWWWPASAAVLAFALFAGTGLLLSARAARR